MKKTKRVSLASILSALSVVVMSLGAFIQVVDLTAVALASVMVIFARIELGPPYEWLVYGVSGTISPAFVSTMARLVFTANFSISPWIP